MPVIAPFSVYFLAPFRLLLVGVCYELHYGVILGLGLVGKPGVFPAFVVYA